MNTGSDNFETKVSEVKEWLTGVGMSEDKQAILFENTPRSNGVLELAHTLCSSLADQKKLSEKGEVEGGKVRYAKNIIIYAIDDMLAKKALEKKANETSGKDLHTALTTEKKSEEKPVEKPKFYTTLELNKKITVDEAIEKLMTYHGVDKERILSRFPQLKSSTTKTVLFKNGDYRYEKCIEMEGYEENRMTSSWHYYMKTSTGNIIPIQHVG